MTEREKVLARARVAGYHGDRAYATRLYAESRVALHEIQKAFDDGLLARAKGVACSCPPCRFASADANRAGLQTRTDIASKETPDENRKKPH